MLETVKVSEWMNSPVISITPETPIVKAHEIMQNNNIRRLPVVKNNKLVGIVTIGDVREARPSDATSLSIWELNALWTKLIVDKIMSTNVLTISPDSPIIEAAHLMLEHKFSGLPVVDEDNHLVGMLTESDIFRMLVKAKDTIPA